jgi:TonB family protein
LIHFDIDNRYQDELIVGSAISRREGVIFSIVSHALLILAIILVPRLPMFQISPEELAQRRAALEAQLRAQQDRTFVFVQPRIDLKALKPPERAPLSDADRQAQTRETPPTANNPLPFSRGNSSDRTEEANREQARGEENQNQPTLQPQPESQEARVLPPSDEGFRRPPPQATTPQSRPTGSLGEALRNLQQYVQKQTFDNPRGGQNQPGAAIQFDTKGVEFGPWLRRFVAQVRRNWFIPQAAMTFHGHVVLQFNIHKDGTITDVTVAQPSDIPGFNSAAVGAIMGSSPTEPLPPEYPTDTAFFTVTFYYNEDPDRQ